MVLLTPFEGPKTAPRHHRHRRRSIGSPTHPFFESSFVCVSPWACCLGHFFFAFFFVRENREPLIKENFLRLRLLRQKKEKKESHHSFTDDRHRALLPNTNTNTTNTNKKSVSKNTHTRKEFEEEEEEYAPRGTESDLRSWIFETRVDVVFVVVAFARRERRHGGRIEKGVVLARGLFERWSIHHHHHHHHRTKRPTTTTTTTTGTPMEKETKRRTKTNRSPRPPRPR